MTERCVPQNLVLGDSGFGCVYRYHSTKRLEEILAPEFFLPARSQLRAGDWIRIFQMENADIQGHGNRVLRMCDVVVVYVTQRAVHLEQVGAVHEMPLDFDEAEAAVAVVPARPKLKPKWKGPVAMWTVVDPDGTVLSKGISDKKIAEQMAAGGIPLPGLGATTPTSPSTTSDQVKSASNAPAAAF